MPAPAFKPYAYDAASLGIGELTLENGTACVAIYGKLDLTRDKAGLKLECGPMPALATALSGMNSGPLPAR